MQSNINYTIEIRTPVYSIRKTTIPHKSLDETSTVEEEKLNALNIGMYIKNIIDHHLSKHHQSCLDINAFNKKYDKLLLNIAKKSVNEKPYILTKDIKCKVDDKDLYFQCLVIKEKLQDK